MRQFAVSASQIKGMSVKEVGDVLGDLAKSGESANDVCDEIEEFFRVNFRKISFDDAAYALAKMGADESAKKIEALDDKFWVWETLEEATRPDLDELDA